MPAQTKRVWISSVSGFAVRARLLEVDLFEQRAKVKTRYQEGWVPLTDLKRTRQEAETR